MSHARMRRCVTFGARATPRAAARAASSPRHAPETSQTPEAESKPSRTFSFGATENATHAASYARDVAASSGERTTTSRLAAFSVRFFVSESLRKEEENKSPETSSETSSETLSFRFPRGFFTPGPSARRLDKRASPESARVSPAASPGSFRGPFVPSPSVSVADGSATGTRADPAPKSSSSWSKPAARRRSASVSRIASSTADNTRDMGHARRRASRSSLLS